MATGARHDELSWDAAGYLVSLIPLYHTTVFRHKAGLTGLQAAQFRILKVLTVRGSLPMSGIGRSMCISKPYMTALVDSMEKEGLVSRQPDPDDRRVIRIVITEEGKDRLAAIANAMRDGIQSRLGQLGDDDLALLCRSLRDLQAILRKIPEQ